MPNMCRTWIFSGAGQKDEQKKPILTLEYTIQPEEHLHFNQYFANGEFPGEEEQNHFGGRH